MNLKSLFTIVTIASILIIGDSILNAQGKKSNGEGFKITIEKKQNEIILECHEGCSWKDLTYKNKKEFQAIDENGMRELNDSQSNQDRNFLFTIKKTKGGVSLKGIKGSAWIDLSFTLKNGQKQMINQGGMISEK